LEPSVQRALVRDLSAVDRALRGPDPYAFALETPEDFFTRRRGGPPPPAPAADPAVSEPAASPSGPRVAATESLAARTGALIDEVDFPAFVASLVHGTFDAIVEASIRQMEEFADLVSAVAKDIDQFTSDNVTPNQARDMLVQRHPADLVLELPTAAGGEPRVRVRTAEGEESSPSWLADYGLEGEPLTDELVEQSLVPAARRSVGESRQQLLATMVLLGMNRVVVRDGSVSARVRFRAAAQDHAKVDYAVSSDPGGASTWGQRGSAMYAGASTMVSTVGVNVQSDTDIKAELYGEVKINFVSETLPLDRFADSAKLTLLQRNSRTSGPAPATGSGASAPAASPAPGAGPGGATPLPIMTPSPTVAQPAAAPPAAPTSLVPPPTTATTIPAAPGPTPVAAPPTAAGGER
jgi:hypothetical protein